MPPAPRYLNPASLQRPWCYSPAKQPAYVFFYSPSAPGSDVQTLISGNNTVVTLTASLHTSVDLADAAAGTLALQETVFNAAKTSPTTLPIHGMLTLFLGTQGTLTVMVVQSGDAVSPVDFVVPAASTSAAYQYEIASGTGAFFNANGFVQVTVASTSSARQIEVFLNP